MSEDKQADKDPERTLLTLEQLSQTIEVMTSVVNRLRQHLSEQLRAQTKDSGTDNALPESVPAVESVTPVSHQPAADKPEKRESFIVEIRQQEPEPVRKSDKILH